MKRNTANRDRIRRSLAKDEPPCWLCGSPIDYRLNFIAGQHGAKCRKTECKGCVPDPMRFEADHVVPLHRDGADVLANSRASHRACNSKKRARLVAPIVRRSGTLA